MISRIWSPLPDQQLLFRVHRNASSRNPKTGKAKPKAFFRREGELGLSVFLSREAALLSGMDVTGGMCSVSVRHVRHCRLGVALIQDREDHAELRNVPLRLEDEQRALDIANYLAEIADDVPV
jgi:hypothetical protein